MPLYSVFPYSMLMAHLSTLASNKMGPCYILDHWTFNKYSWLVKQLVLRQTKLHKAYHTNLLSSFIIHTQVASPSQIGNVNDDTHLIAQLGTRLPSLQIACMQMAGDKSRRTAVSETHRAESSGRCASPAGSQ